ncbi:MAG: hypothetical protein F6K11_27190 [Leptolyngbya sp. SIO3F4]|nr:hypothetical protein [Leptolyngbya sp. SIO3F4]
MAADLNPLKTQVQNFFDQNQLWIEEQSISRLVVKQRLKRYVYAFVVIWSVLFAGIPLGLVGLVASRSGIETLSCQQNRETTGFDCTLSKRNWLGLGPESDHQSISAVVDATSDSATWSDDKGGGTGKTWVTLRNQSGHLRIFETSYPLGSIEPTFQTEAVKEIQRLLNSDINTFTLEDDARSRWKGQFSGLLVLMSPFVLISILIAYTGLRSRTITLDKANNRYIRQINTLLGKRIRDYDLAEIQSVTIKKVRQHTENGRYYAYRLEINLKSDKQYRLIPMRSHQTVSKVASEIQSFIQPN